MAFKPIKYNASDVKAGLMDNSEALTIGEVIIPGVQGDTSVVKTGGGTTSYLLGVTMGFKDQNGNTLELNTVTAASDNVTVKQLNAIYLPLHVQPTEFISDLNAAAETTDNSGAFGNFAVDSTGLLVSESSVQAFGTRTNLQLFSYGLTGLNTTQVSCVFFATMVGGLS